jgi:hypothetical protein
MKELEDFIENWKETEDRNRQAFIELYENMQTL